jgi:hypothetical protein
MTHIVLIVENQRSTSNFHYSLKTGRPLIMLYCRTRKAHVARFPLDEWRKDNFRIARNLLDQMLPVPILFDIEVEQVPAPPAPAAPEPEPPKESLPQPAPKPVRIRRLTKKERAELREGQ